MQKEMIVISLGGSIIVPDKVDVAYLKAFRKTILKNLRKKRFVIICGGGRTARRYQDALSQLVSLSAEDLDWIGIHATRLNASLLLSAFKGETYEKVVKRPLEKISTAKHIIIAAGWKPGFSTDYCAVLLAKNFGVKTILNLTDVDYVYDKNPKKFKDAKSIKDISWRAFKSLVGGKWTPGLRLPFDPIASMEAERLGLRVIVLGRSQKNLDNYLSGKSFTGTVIHR